MQVYYRSFSGQDGPASPEERKALRRAMIDYGALQPSPVQKPSEAHKGPDTTIVQTLISPPPQEVGHITKRFQVCMLTEFRTSFSVLHWVLVSLS
jgi:hypothetical protein